MANYAYISTMIIRHNHLNTNVENQLMDSVAYQSAQIKEVKQFQITIANFLANNTNHIIYMRLTRTDMHTHSSM